MPLTAGLLLAGCDGRADEPDHPTLVIPGHQDRWGVGADDVPKGGVWSNLLVWTCVRGGEEVRITGAELDKNSTGLEVTDVRTRSSSTPRRPFNMNYPGTLDSRMLFTDKFDGRVPGQCADGPKARFETAFTLRRTSQQMGKTKGFRFVYEADGETYRSDRVAIMFKLWCDKECQAKDEAARTS